MTHVDGLLHHSLLAFINFFFIYHFPFLNLSWLFLQIKKCAYDVTDGVYFLHDAARIVHRRLCPETIFCTDKVYKKKREEEREQREGEEEE